MANGRTIRVSGAAYYAIAAAGARPLPPDRSRGRRPTGSGGLRRDAALALTSADLGGSQRIGVQSTPKRRARIRDVVPVVTTNQSAIEFVQQLPGETGFLSRAAVVSEGALKPQTDFGFEVKTAPVRTIAHWTPATRQVLDDVAGLRASIDGDLVVGLEIAEELEVLYGDSTGQHLHGLVPQATALDPVAGVDAPTEADVVAMAIKQLTDVGLDVDAIVLNSSDWMRMLTSKDSEGRYYSAGGPFGASPGLLWNRTVVPTPAMDEGFFLTGSFAAAATIYDRMATTVLISTEDSDNFRRNLVTILAEERIALAVRRPAALVYGSLTPST